MTVYKNTALNKVLQDFKSKTNFYKKKLLNVKLFDDAPFTFKNELLLSQEQSPVYGDYTNLKYSISQVYRTSGTLSNPLILAFSENDVNILTDIEKESLMYAGMGKQGNAEIVINCLNYSMWTGGAFDAQAILKTGVQLVNFGAGNTRALINFILLLRKNKKYKVSLHCTPSYLAIIETLLFEEFKMTPDSLGIYTFYLGGESGIQNHAFRKKLISIWNSKIYNANYGMSEINSTMASANDYNHLKFSQLLMKNFILELNIDNGKTRLLQDLKEGDKGELIATSLCKECQPLFRYNTKEIIELIKIKENDIFFEVVSRSDDMFIYKGINVFPEQFRNILCNITDLTGRSVSYTHLTLPTIYSV